GYPTEQSKQPDPDPLAASRYSCIYWVDHLCENRACGLHDGGTINKEDVPLLARSTWPL
ncbi:uncharacterized protein BDR25DRAFT_229776, partial [Lindgomyces ingoldianus]